MNRTVSDIINEWINTCPNISKNIDDIKFYKDETCKLKIDYRVYEENRDSLDNIEIDFWYDEKIISNLFSNGIKLVRFKRRVIGEKKIRF